MNTYSVQGERAYCVCRILILKIMIQEGGSACQLLVKMNIYLHSLVLDVINHLSI